MSILSTEAGTGEIGGADEGFFAIDDDGFGVNARAKNSFKLVAIAALPTTQPLATARV